MDMVVVLMISSGRLEQSVLNLLEKGEEKAATSIAAVSIMMHNGGKYLPA